MRRDDDLLGRSSGQHAGVGIDLDPRDFGIGVLAERGAGRDPAADDLILVRARDHLPAAAVRNLGRRLRQQKAFIRRGGKESAAAPFLDERLIVEGRLKPQKTETEAVLTARLTVAAPTIAAELSEDRHHLVREVDRQAGREVPDFDRDVRLVRASADGDRRLAIALRRDDAQRIDRRHRGIGTRKRRRRRQVAALTAWRNPFDGELLDRIGTAQQRLGRDDHQRARRRGACRRRIPNAFPEHGQHEDENANTDQSASANRPIGTHPRRLCRSHSIPSPLDPTDRNRGGLSSRLRKVSSEVTANFNRWGGVKQPIC